MNTKPFYHLQILTLLSLACSQPPTSSSGQPSYNATNQGDQGLTVTISGGTTVSVPQTNDYTASVSGGSGPFYFYWSVAYCNKDEFGTYCTSTFSPYAEGTNLDAFQYSFGEYEDETRILVEVRQTSTYGLSGVDTIEVLGPGHWPLPISPDDPLHSRCTREVTPGWYPFEDAIGVYRRNVCTNLRERPAP